MVINDMGTTDRFMITNHIVDINLDKKYLYTVILFDYAYWAQHIDSTLMWMNDNFKGMWYHSGMLIGIELESDTLLFTLRYS